MEIGGQHHDPAALYPQKEPNSRYRGGEQDKLTLLTILTPKKTVSYTTRQENTLCPTTYTIYQGGGKHGAGLEHFRRQCGVLNLLETTRGGGGNTISSNPTIHFLFMNAKN
jgi:hypothetical protein